MSEYMTLIMGAAFIIIASVVVKLVTQRSLHKEDKKQRDLNFPEEPKVEQSQREMTAGARR